MSFPSPTPLSAWADLLEPVWPRGPVAVYAQTASTQDVCRGRPEGFLCVAGRQTAGRGRLGRAWVAPADQTLTLSFTAPPDLSHGRLSLAVPVAVCRALAPLLAPAGLAPAIKWPNDVFVGRRKLAGILIEVENGLPIVGLGLNVGTRAEDFPEDLRDKATSLAALGCLPSGGDRLPVLLDLLPELDRVLEEMRAAPDAVLVQWRSLALSFPASFRCDGVIYSGEVLDVDADRGLVLRLVSGEITHLPAARTTTAG